MKILGNSIRILIAIVILLVVGLVAFDKFVDPNRVKTMITAEVQRQTGYQLAIDGEFAWSFYPVFGIKAGSIRIFAPQQPKKPFAVLKDVTLGMEIMQLVQGKKNLSGDVHVGQMTLMNLQAKKVSAEVSWENNVLTISPLSCMLYDGWMSGTVHAQNLNKTPYYDWDVQFNRVQLKPLLYDLGADDSKLTVDGIGQLRMEAKTNGLSKDSLIKHLQGTMSFNLGNGVVSGIDLNYLVSTAVDIINKQPISQPNNITQTSFESLTGTMKIKNGVTSSDDTVLIAPAFTVKSTGVINLSGQTIDYSLDVIPQNLEQLKWGIPVIVEGDLQNPKVKLDTLKINTIIANEEFQRMKEKAKEKIKELPKGIDKFLGKVLGGQ